MHCVLCASYLFHWAKLFGIAEPAANALVRARAKRFCAAFWPVGGGEGGSGVLRHGLAIEAHPATPAASQRTYAIREIRRGGIVYTSD